MSSIIERLTEGVVNRDMRAEGSALLSKWERTGLLEGLDSDRQKSSMARLLENQAKELLRESSSMSAGDVEGFAAVAFPIVRRVFAGLIANDLVSVQPMSLQADSFSSSTFVLSVQVEWIPHVDWVTLLISRFTVQTSWFANHRRCEPCQLTQVDLSGPRTGALVTLTLSPSGSNGWWARRRKPPCS